MPKHYTKTEADMTYVSKSTIDHEPTPTQGDEQQGQVEMFSIDTEAEKLNAEPHERKIKAELVLKITPSGDKTVTIPVIAGNYPSTRVPEVLKLAIEGRRFKRILNAALDNPISINDALDAIN